MGCVVREPLHCLAAQPRETAIFEGESPDSPRAPLEKMFVIPGSNSG
jgi:hypothetical protein